MPKCNKCWLGTIDALNLINSADKNGNVLFECKGLSPVLINFPNIDEVRNMVTQEFGLREGGNNK